MEIYMKDGKALKVSNQFVKPAGGQTGETWIWNKTISIPTRVKNYTISFISNNVEYKSVSRGRQIVNGISYNANEDGTEATVVYDFYDEAWENEAYRTITFLESPSGDLLTFLQANATKQ